MKRLLYIACFCLLLHTHNVVVAEEKCDNPKSLEKVRIYFANGMSNSMARTEQNLVALASTLNYEYEDYGVSYNDNEFWFTQLLQAYRQRKNESDEFWFWLRHMDEAPQWFRDEYAIRVGRFNDTYVRNDVDLQNHIKQYLRDLNSGKKVLIVGHSQGNFYANNAYRHIYINYPKYRKSIAIISVATPSNVVEGGGSYVTNPKDLIIKLVRALFHDTLSANVPPYDQPNSLLNHEFVGTYLTGYRSTIVNFIRQKIATLDSPEKAWECSEPEEVSVEVKIVTAKNVTDSTALLYGKVVSGKSIATRCVWRKSSHGNPKTCFEIKNKISSTGKLNTGDTFRCTATELLENTYYRYRVCGRRFNDISDGGVVTFKTKSRSPNTWSSWASPSDPVPGQNVTIYVDVNISGVTVRYYVVGTDGYRDSGSKISDSTGKISFIVPGADAGVTDTVTVSVPGWGSGYSKTWQYRF